MSVEVMYPEELDSDRVYKRLERVARICYKSEDRICEGSAEKLLKGTIMKKKHYSILEHEKISVLFVADRGISHEAVRHRVGIAFAQESTRYCDYGGELQVIEPLWKDEDNELIKKQWRRAMDVLEDVYTIMREAGSPPQEARHVLPIGLKTEIIITANLREWKHIFSVRTGLAAHPHIRFLMKKLEAQFVESLPILFGKNDQD